VSGLELVCDFGDMEGWAWLDRYLYLRPNNAGSMTLNGTVQMATEDSDPGNNSGAFTVQINDPAPTTVSTDLKLGVFKITSSRPRVGRALGFKFKLINLGDEVAEDVRFTMPVPAGFSWVSGPSECGISGAILSCAYGSLNSDASRTRYFYLRPSTAGDITVTGSAAMDTNDANPANDERSVSFTVR
jgi:hypothetical protein